MRTSPPVPRHAAIAQRTPRRDPQRRARARVAAAVGGAAVRALRGVARHSPPRARRPARRGVDRRRPRPRSGRPSPRARAELRSARVVHVLGAPARAHPVGPDAGAGPPARRRRSRGAARSRAGNAGFPVQATAAAGRRGGDDRANDDDRGGRAAAARLRPRRWIRVQAARRARGRVRRGEADDRGDRRGRARTRRCSAIARRSPILEVRRRALDPDGRAARVGHDRYRGDAFEITIHNQHALPRSGVALRTAAAPGAGDRARPLRGAADSGETSSSTRGASPSAVVMPTPGDDLDNAHARERRVTRNGSPGAVGIHAEPALADTSQTAHAQQPARLASTSSSSRSSRERPHGAAVLVGVAQDQVAVRQLRDDQVDPAARQLRGARPQPSRTTRSPAAREAGIAEQAQPGQQCRAVPAARGAATRSICSLQRVSPLAVGAQLGRSASKSGPGHTTITRAR